MKCPAQGAAGGWVMPGLVFQRIPLCEFSQVLESVLPLQRLRAWSRFSFFHSSPRNHELNSEKVSSLDGWHEVDFWSITIQQNGGDSSPHSNPPQNSTVSVWKEKACFVKVYSHPEELAVKGAGSKGSWPQNDWFLINWCLLYTLWA